MKQLWLAVVILMALGLVGSGLRPAAAQDYQSLRNQIDQLRQQVRELSGQVNDLSRGGVASTGAASGGESPGTLSRLDEIMESMRRLNGRVEELEFKVDNLSRGLDAVKRTIEVMPLAPTAPLNAGTAAPIATATGAPATTGAAPVSAPAPLGNQAPAPTSNATSAATSAASDFNPNEAPRPLSAMPINPGAAAASSEPAVAATAPEKPAAPNVPAEEAVVAAATPATPKEQYDVAHRLLKNGQYVEAEAAFREFLEANPKDPNVSKASYWLGETYYVRKQYDQAYQVYARNLQRWPKGEKAPDNLVKLALSLVSLKLDSEACQFLAVLDSDYPNAAGNVKQAGERAKKLAKCK
ncbi:MAG: tol-pal system protein YbgF [Alphaproteobacteria bacterium]|nr:tol-pal system protein YbgF [Alphaproteobacteria bacterium]